MRYLLLVLFFITLAPAFAADEVVYTMPGAFSVSRPSAAWKWVTDKNDADGVSLSNDRYGLDVVFRWVSNVKRMDSDHITRSLRLRLMDNSSYEGQAFSSVSTFQLGGAPASSFKVERTTASSALHRTRYIVVSRGTHALVIAVMGGARLTDKHQAEIDAIIKSVTFPK